MGRRKEKYNLEDILITGFAAKGVSIAKVETKVIFVPFTVVGDIVDIEVYKQKKSYCFGRVIRFKHFSDKRVEPKCKLFGICGGCSWQMMDYQWQKYFKQQEVIDNLTRIGKIDCQNIEPIVGAEKIYNYRNKLEFTFSNRSWVKDFDKEAEPIGGLGFHIGGMFDKVLDIEECFLQESPSNEIRNFVKEFCIKNGIEFYNIREHTGLMRNLIIRFGSENDLMVIVVFAYEDDRISMVLKAIENQFEQITSLQYCINDKLNDSLTDREFKVFSGKDHIMEYMIKDDKTRLQFKIRPKTFYQTNPAQALKLYTLAERFADISDEDIVYDLYTGTGTIANFVAKRAKKVIGIEYVDQAVEDARLNSQENEITNTEFFAGDMAKVLNSDFVTKNGKPSIIITDPPRNGMDPKVIDQILSISPRRIVYVSCNVATQARDLFLLKDQYLVTRIRPVDMFPQTHHIENIVLLEKKQS